MNKNLKVGLLGAGFIVDAHAKALKVLPNIEITAVCDRAIERAQDTAKAYGIAHVFADLTEMLKLKLDVVHVLLPPDLHIDITRQILEAGTSVFLEKPMGLDAVACQSLVDLAKQKGLKLGVNHNFLFLPAYEQLRDEGRTADDRGERGERRHPERPHHRRDGQTDSGREGATVAFHPGRGAIRPNEYPTSG